MTLQVVFDKEKMNSIMDVMPDIFSVYKVVLDDPFTNSFRAPCLKTPYCDDLNEAKVIDSLTAKNAEYELFYHFWVQKYFVLDKLNEYLEFYSSIYRNVARCSMDLLDSLSLSMADCRKISWSEYGAWQKILRALEEGFPRVISCIVQKNWVTAIGKQHDGLAVVCKRAIFPRYPANYVSPETKIAYIEPMPDCGYEEDDIAQLEPAKIYNATHAIHLENHIRVMPLLTKE